MVFTKRGIDLNDVNVLKRIEKIFPDYFQRFKLPDGAREELIKVYRACRSGKCDKNSFLPSFEENGCVINLLVDLTYPGQYSLSKFEKTKDGKGLQVLYLI
jgi:hypothetical protein